MAVNLVLLVDDNDTDNFINQRIIELTQFASNVVVKNSGKAALEFLQEADANGEALPDVIFLDINMPIIDGFIFLYEFEQLSDNVRNKCKVAVLSSSDNKRDIDRMIDNEYVIKFITKPLTEEALNDVDAILQQPA